MQKAVKRYPFGLLADLFEYPREGYEEKVEDAMSALGESPEATRQLRQFHDKVDEYGVGELKEYYTDTFELSSTYTLNTSHHLYEGFDRSRFLAMLNGMYEEQGFTSKWLEEKNNLPDHISVILEYLEYRGEEGLEDEEFRQFVEDYLVKALEGLRKNFEESQSETPYSLLVKAVDRLVNRFVEEEVND